MNPYLKDLHFKLSRCGGQHQTSRNCLGFMGFWVTPGRRASKELVVGDHCNHLMTAEVWTEIHIYRGRYQSWRQPPKLGQFCKVWNTTKLKQVTPSKMKSHKENNGWFRICFFFQRDSRKSSPLPKQVHQTEVWTKEVATSQSAMAPSKNTWISNRKMISPVLESVYPFDIHTYIYIYKL